MPLFSPTKRSAGRTQGTPNAKRRRSPIADAKNVLSVAYVEGLVGRDEEYRHLYEIIRSGLNECRSQTFYISGPAGTGKTLTVQTVIDDLKKQKFKFQFITVNCMSFQNAADFYAKILANFKPKRGGSTMNPTFTEVKNCISQSKTMIVLLLDEIDQLQTKNHDVLNNVFKLSAMFNDRVILIGIANSLDFTAKMFWLKDDANRDHFHEIRFLPYKKEQIVQIIQNRLKMVANNNENVLIDRMAIEFCARKIASCSGDIRKALDVCRRAIELIENKIEPVMPATSPLKQRNQKSSPKTAPNDLNVNVKVMMDALNKVYGTAIDKIECETKTFLPSDQQVILSTFLVLIKTKSMREIRLGDFRELLVKICRRNGITTEGKTESDIVAMCQYLADYGYVTVTKRDSIGNGGGSSSSPFKRTPKKTTTGTITVTLMIDPVEAEQLISPFHRSIVSDAYSYA